MNELRRLRLLHSRLSVVLSECTRAQDKPILASDATLAACVDDFDEFRHLFITARLTRSIEPVRISIFVGTSYHQIAADVAFFVLNARANPELEHWEVHQISAGMDLELHVAETLVPQPETKPITKAIRSKIRQAVRKVCNKSPELTNQGIFDRALPTLDGDDADTFNINLVSKYATEFFAENYLKCPQHRKRAVDARIAKAKLKT